MRILMIGTGYVGLVTGACFSQMGHHVFCLDIDKHKIDKLQNGLVPFFEPGLQELVHLNIRAGRLHFTTDYTLALEQTEICFLAVATPENKQTGACDLSYILQASSQVAENLSSSRIIVIKSTVPPGTSIQIQERMETILQRRNVPFSVDILSNPEFLKEGAAVQDCMKPSRILIGGENPDAIETLKQLYAPFTLSHDRILVMDRCSAELTKYAANAMLATRISFMNELSELCEKVGADIQEVRRGIGSDERIGHAFLYAGIGYGGSCFPKDLKALHACAQESGLDMPLLSAVQQTNTRQRELFCKKILSYFQGDLSGKTFAIWGLAFKPDTDDIREAPSLFVLDFLLRHGAQVRLYDPIAMPNMSILFPPSNTITYCSNEYEAATGADAICLITEWKQFRSIDWEKLLHLFPGKALFDARNQYKQEKLQAQSLDYFGMGIPQHTLC